MRPTCRKIFYLFILLGLKADYYYAGIKDTTKCIVGISVGPTEEFRYAKFMGYEEYNPYAWRSDAYELKSQVFKQGIYARINFDYPISTHGFYLATGIEYQDKGYQTKMMSDTSTGTYASGGTYTIIVNHQELYHYRYVSLPIGLRYFIIDKKIKINVLAGIAVSLWGKMYVNELGDRNYHPGDPTSLSHSVDVALKAGLGYQISSHFQISVDPGYSTTMLFAPTLFGTTQNAYSAHLYSFILPLTISYVFTK